MTEYRIVQERDNFYVEKRGWFFWSQVRWYSPFLQRFIHVTYSKESAEEALRQVIDSTKDWKQSKAEKKKLPTFLVHKKVTVDYDNRIEPS